MQPSAEDVAQAIDDEGGDEAVATSHAVSHGIDMTVKTNLLQTRLMQVFPRDAVKSKKTFLKREMADPNPDGTQRRSPRVKAASQPDADSLLSRLFQAHLVAPLFVRVHEFWKIRSLLRLLFHSSLR